MESFSSANFLFTSCTNTVESASFPVNEKRELAQLAATFVSLLADASYSGAGRRSSYLWECI